MGIKFDHRNIEIFQAIMTAGSLTGAAEQLRTSQPTVSRELAAFERQLGFKLFERRARRVFATEQALQLYAEVKRSYVGLDHLIQIAQTIFDNVTSHIQIACLPLFSETMMPRVCSRLIAGGSNARLTFHSLDNAELMRELLALHYELGIVEIGVAVDGLQIDHCEIGNEVCIVPAEHPLAGLEVIRPDDLRGQSLITFPPDDRYRRRFDRIFSDIGLSNSVRIETNTAGSVCALVEAGLGVGLVNPISAWAWRDRRIVIRPFSIPIPFIVGVCQSLGRPSSKLAGHVTALVLEECATFRDELAAAQRRTAGARSSKQRRR
ncbi:LysR substrate-binding domain-containing protein [Dongia sedimenti]|uniref:LysR substrate-binding domain-containing protein n=1 Tax=Dongia sedimenti TaxID=3064282 RepID=A0ABU0YSG9_9PROT|nr:LysR substrate-binding domain-containing protein [Rhodospirillaceae bacterium R-7]